MHSPIGRMFRECSVIEEQRKTTKDFSCPSSALPRQTVAAKMPCTVRLPRWATARYVSYLYWPLVLALVLLVNCILCFELSAEDACKDFVGDDPSLGWRLDECIAVWKAWASTVPLTESPAIHESLRRVAGDLQRAGSTCFLKGEISMDGAGSSAMRSIMTLLLAEDLGCKWVSPEWGRPVMGKNGAVLYCHEKLGKGHNKIDILAEKEKYNAVCSVIDWMEYFRFAQESVSLPESGTAKVVQFDQRPLVLRNALQDLESLDIENRDWDHLVLEVGKATGAHFIVSPGEWDDFKRNVVRGVLQAMRNQFHESRPRNEWPIPRCAFVPGKLNFGIHVRMGDRENAKLSLEQYPLRLNAFMDTVSMVVVKMGFEAPMFHIFSETQEPCPHEDTLKFDEFPLWPLDAKEIRVCQRAKTPATCLEMRAGLSSCPPARSGIFHVKNRQLVLHVGHDVANEMSCMVHADGMLTGCSTFGQVAGLLSRGLKFFSIACDGPRTPPHYKTLPPLALAERGEKWIPVNGSWHDPELMSQEILERELSKSFQNTPLK